MKKKVVGIGEALWDVLPEAHTLPVNVSAWVCTQNGAMPELPETFKNRIS